MVKKIFQKIKPIFISCKKNDYKPYFLKGKFLIFVVIGLFILRIAILPFFIQFSKSIFFAKIVSSELISLLNKERTVSGLNSLKENSELAEAALLKAQDMLNNNYFGHESPKGIKGWYFIDGAGYDYQMAGENLAIGFLDSDEVHQAWNDSPSHKANLLNPNFKEIGIAVLQGEFQGNKTTVVVQLFGKPKQKPVIQEETTTPPIELEKNREEEPSIEKSEPIITEEIMPSLAEESQNGPKETIGANSELVQGLKAIEENKELEGKQLEEGVQKEIIITKINSLKFNLLAFLATKYNRAIEGIIIFSAFLINLALIINLFLVLISSMALEKKPVLIRTLALPSFVAIILLISLGIFGDSLIWNLIPHKLII